MMRIVLALILGLFATDVMAQAAPPAPSVGEQLIPLILIFVIFYFLILRPQSKKMKEHRDMVAALAKGDYVVTAGGIIAKVTAVVDDEKLTVELASGVEVTVVRSTVSDKLSAEAVKELKPKKAPAKKKSKK